VLERIERRGLTVLKKREALGGREEDGRGEAATVPC